MCGRYAATANPDELVLSFEVEQDRTSEPTRTLLRGPQVPPAGSPDHNMAPTKLAPVVLTRVPREDPDHPPVRQLRLLTWGLVPSWSADTSGAARMINARAESVAAKRSFAPALSARRAIVPAAGWYEWQPSPTARDAKGAPRRQPFFIHRLDGEPIAFAGLYEFWRDRTIPDPGDPQAWLTTFTIVTVPAEPGLDRIHDRQPLVLEHGDWGRWLDPALTRPETIADLLAGGPPGRFTAYPVSTAVSSSRANGPQLLEPIAPALLDGVVDPMTGEIVGAR